jgi:hypothetical protein
VRCSQIDELLSEYVDGALDGSTREEMERHLAGCPRCGAELAELNLYRQAMRNVHAVQPPADFLAGIHRRIEAESAWRRFFNKVFVPMRIKLPLEFAGILATAVLLVVFYQHTLLQKRPELNSGSSQTSRSPEVSLPGESPPPQMLQKRIAAPSSPAPAQPLGETTTIRLSLFLKAPRATAEAKTADKDSSPAPALEKEAGRAGSIARQQDAERKPAALSAPPAGLKRDEKDDDRAPAALRGKPMPLHAAAVPSNVLAAVKEQVMQLKGSVLSAEELPADGRPLSITIQLPAKNYPFLLDFLRQLGPLAPLPPTLPDAGAAEAEQLKIELTIIR